MVFLVETFFSGCISKIINDGKDYSWAKIKRVINDKNDQNISTKIYRVIERVLNIVTNNGFKETDILYDAIEKIFIEFKEYGDTIEAVKCGWGLLCSDISIEQCEIFIEKFNEEICQDDNLYREIDLMLQEKEVRTNRVEFQKFNEKIDKNHTELIKRIDCINENMSGSGLLDYGNITTKKVKFPNNKKQKYIKNWNSRLFLHMYNDENPITLADAFIMPDYEMHSSVYQIEFGKNDTLDKVIEKFIKYEKTSTMLIAGVPGIGKSTIISWIAHKYRYDNRIIVLRFRDWEREELEVGLLKAICNILECKKKDLEKNVLVLDGFDEMKLLDDRDRVLRFFLSNIKDFDNFKCIITSRPAYIRADFFDNVFELNEFNIVKVGRFYKKITGKFLINRENIEPNLKVLGIPVILYMAIMSNVDMDGRTSKPELYTLIFAEKGGIFDRFCGYDNGSQILRDPDNIKKFLKFLCDTAFKMFEKDTLQIKLEECEVPNLSVEEREISILEFPIKHLFENIEANIEFVHKSIYEYFVSEYIFTHIYACINEDEPSIKLANFFGCILSKDILPIEILEFLDFKIKSSIVYKKKCVIYETFQLMLKDGMTFYTSECYRNILKCEMNVFANMLKIIHFWDCSELKFDFILRYIKHNIDLQLNLSGMRVYDTISKRTILIGVNLPKANLKESNLKNAYLQRANLRDVDLRKANLCGSQLRGADLIGANLEKADLRKANLRGADLIGANLKGANLEKAILEKTDLRESNLDGAKIEDSIWNAEDVLEIRPLMQKAIFNYIKLQHIHGQERIDREQLFSL